MTNSIKTRVLPALILALSLNFCLGQAPTDFVTFKFDASNFPIWDLTGNYQLEQQMLGAGGLVVPVSYGISLSQDNSGRLRGSGVTTVAIGNNPAVAANYVASGMVSGGGLKTHANFVVRLVGQDTIAGTLRTFSISISYTTLVDPQTQTLTGTCRGTVSIGGIGRARIIPDSLTPPALPFGVDGAWSVTLDIVTLQTLGGGATINIDNFNPGDFSPVAPGTPGAITTRVLPANISGSYSSRLNLARLRVGGTGVGRGATLSLSFAPGDTQPQKMSGRILGEAIRF